VQRINRDAGNNVAYPVCKTKFQLPVAAVEGLPNNLYAIHMAKEENEKKARQLVLINCLYLITYEI